MQVFQKNILAVFHNLLAIICCFCLLTTFLRVSWAAFQYLPCLEFAIFFCFINCGRRQLLKTIKFICNIAAQTMNFNKYPIRQSLGKYMFRWVVSNFNEYGSFKKPEITCKNCSGSDKENNVMQADWNHEISLRDIEPKSMAQFIFKRQKWKTFKFFRPGDDVGRKNFSDCTKRRIF